MLAIAALAASAPAPAQAVGALFRAQFVYYGVSTPLTLTWPPSKGPGKAPPATACVGPTSPAGRVFLPRSFIDYRYVYLRTYCYPSTCISGTFSYVNGRASFRPSNPYGAAQFTTIVFPTTLGNPVPNRGSGEPLTPTTAYGGRFDFGRGGSLMIQPGPSRFGGSMRLLYGPNARLVRSVSSNTPYRSRAYSTFRNPTEFDETEPGEITSSGMVTRFRLTSFGAREKTPGGAYLSARAYYLHTLNPWTTGRVSGYQPLGSYLTRQTYTGYDARTPNRMHGVLSLVWPRLVHAYEIASDPSAPIAASYQAVRTWRLKITFLPEPGALLSLCVGIAALAALAQLRRRPGR